MKHTLSLKFILLYAIFGFLSIFAVSALSSPLISHYVEEEVIANLYQDTNFSNL